MKIYSSWVFCKYKGVRGSKGLAAHKADTKNHWPAHIMQNIVSHVSQKSNSWLMCVAHLGTISLRCLAIKSNNWFTRKLGGNAPTPPKKINYKMDIYMYAVALIICTGNHRTNLQGLAKQLLGTHLFRIYFISCQMNTSNTNIWKLINAFHHRKTSSNDILIL